MPTVLRLGPYRFFFYANDHDEPPHVHVQRDSDKAKFWLNPATLQTNSGFDRHEIRRVRELVEENREELLRRWDEFFAD